jgi:arsenate reductase
LSKNWRTLILCTGNSARSQMAEGLLRRDGAGHFDVESAGTNPSLVRPEAIEVMREIGIDISGHRSKSVDEFSGQHFDDVITVCDNAREICPIFPAATRMIHRSFDDPASVDGPWEARLAAFRRTRDEIRVYLREYVAEAGQNGLNGESQRP